MQITSQSCQRVISINSWLPPTGTKTNPWLNFSLTVKQFSVLTMQDDYSGHESTRIRMAQIILVTKISHKIVFSDIPWLFTDFVLGRRNSLTWYKTPWLFPDLEYNLIFLDFSLNVAALIKYEKTWWSNEKSISIELGYWLQQIIYLLATGKSIIK